MHDEVKPQHQSREQRHAKLRVRKNPLVHRKSPQEIRT
jgi:hypothetical protein